MTSSVVQIATCTNITLDQILESAVVLNWKDLLPGRITNLVHVEYRLGPSSLWCKSGFVHRKGLRNPQA
jgi:hypothetical protein